MISDNTLISEQEMKGKLDFGTSKPFAQRISRSALANGTVDLKALAKT